MNDIFVYVNDEIIKINLIEKRIKAGINKNVWCFITNKGNFFTSTPNIKYMYKCNICGKLSNPLISCKTLMKPNGKRICKKCSCSGERNPFYGKTHTQKTIDIISKSTSIHNKELWKNDEYRKKVIKGISKPRRESFKKEQSNRITQWYIDNPEQRTIRSIHMKSSWQKMKIVPNIHSISRSKGENKLFEFLKKSLSNLQVECKQTIHINDKWYLPDILINDKIIVEYFGDYWHCNPKKYNENDIIAHNRIVENVWEHDKKRIDILEENKYTVIVVWQSDDYINSNLIERINNLIGK